MNGSELRYVREVMGLGEITLDAMAAHLGVSPAELEAMEAGALAPDHFFDRALEFVGALADRDAERERRARGNGH